jgi:hypothetical protein
MVKEKLKCVEEQLSEFAMKKVVETLSSFEQ